MHISNYFDSLDVMSATNTVQHLDRKPHCFPCVIINNGGLLWYIWSVQVFYYSVPNSCPGEI